tara:strand:- start:2946 stop:3329 length:384 start_codon:yes stop_codon:yes gene_type:complete
MDKPILFGNTNTPMPSDNPNIAPFTSLRSLVNQEEDRTQQYARRVRVSKSVALELVKMDSDDWHAAGRGFFEMNDCRRISSVFLREGEDALNGMSFSIVGPVFSVATDLDAPDVEILEGIPFPGSEA